MGPGAVKDSGATLSVEPGPSAAAQTEHGEDATTPETCRPPSRAPIESVGDSDSASEEEEDIPTPSSKKPRNSETSLVLGFTGSWVAHSALPIHHLPSTR